MIVVISVIALVAAIASVGVVRHRDNAEDMRMQSELSSIYKAMESYRQIYGRYPASYAELNEFISVPNFNQRYEINPNP